MFDARFVGDVAADKTTVSALPLTIFRSRLPCLHIHVGDDSAVAFARESQRCSPSDSRAGARDERYTSFACRH